jgi:hypothetical protein
MCAYITGGVILELTDILTSTLAFGVMEGQGETHKLVFFFLSQQAAFVFELRVFLLGTVSACMRTGCNDLLSAEFEFEPGVWIGCWTVLIV